MKNAWLIAIREFAETAKTKGFWFGILSTPVFIYIGVKVPAFLEKKATPTRYFVLLDRSGEFEKVVEEGLESYYQKQVDQERAIWMGKMAVSSKEEVGEFEEPRRRFQRVPLPAGINTDDTAKSQLRSYLLGDSKIQVDGRESNLFALVVLPEDLGSSRQGVEYWCTNLADTELKGEIERSINEEIRRREFLKSGVDESEVKRIRELKVAVASKDPKKEEGKEQVGELDKFRQWAPVAFVYLLWIAIATIAGMLLNNTTEEKANRVYEVLLSSVTPSEIMFGKLLGIAAVGLSMIVSWIVSLIVVLRLAAGPESKIAGYLFQALVTPELLLAFAGYFLLGYLFYSTIFLALGSLCNTVKEAQSFMGPVMLVMMVPLITMMFIPRDPNGTLATVLSWVPLYTPFVMMNRAAASPPMFDVVGTFILMIVSVAVAVWLSGKIFRVGILRTGQPPKLLELLRWLRH